jgi:hypothetical protein
MEHVWVDGIGAGTRSRGAFLFRDGPVVSLAPRLTTEERAAEVNRLVGLSLSGIG